MTHGHDLLGVVRPAIPRWNLLRKPHVTDESGSIGLPSSRSLTPRSFDAFERQVSKRRVQLDAAPAAGERFRH